MLFRRRSTPTNWISVAQLTTATLSLCTAVAILGTAAHTFHVYQSERAANNPWWLPLWPGHFDVTGTEVYLGTSAGVVLLSAMYFALHFIPNISRQPQLGALITLTTSLLCILLAISAIVLNNILDKSLSRNGKDSIKTWTCRFQHSGPRNSVLIDAGSNMGNDIFGKVCKETMFDFWGMCGILLVQTGLLVTAGLQWRQKEPGIGMNPKASASDINLS